MFSVILPTYNRRDVLARSVSSVLGQTLTDLELIVVDDGSSYDVSVQLKSADDKRLKIVRLPSNLGPSGARNAGLSAATGTYVAFQDSDDSWSSDHLAMALRTYQDIPRTDVTYGRMQAGSQLLRNASPLKSLGDTPPEVFRELSGGNKVALPAITVRRSILDLVGGFDESLLTLEDWDLLLRLAARGSTFTYIDRVVVHVSSSLDGVNRFTGNTVAAAQRILSKPLVNTSDAITSKRLLGQVLYLQGVGYFGAGNLGMGRRTLLKAIRADPSRPKLWLALGLAALGKQHFLRLLRYSKLWWRST